MRISILGAQFIDSLARNLSHSASELGHVVQEVDEGKLVGLTPLRHRFRRLHALAESHPTVQSLRDRLVVQALERFSPDIVLSTLATWHPDSVSRARRVLPQSTRFLFLYPDPQANLGREYPLAAPYDVLFFKDPWVVELYRSRLGINAHYLPEACNPAWHRPVELTAADRERYGCDITTAGNMYYYRAGMLEPLRRYDLRIWGTQYPVWLHSPIRPHYTGVPVAELEKAKAFQAAKIVINSLSRNEIAGTNARTFETAGCGAFQIADWRPALDDLFTADEEIVTFRSRDEMMEKVEFYLNHPEKRARIADAGYRRAHSDHTYEKRWERILQLANLR